MLPIGLDIGAVTPEEIAVAITAELIAVRRRVERDLPHMSWFHRHKSSDQAISEMVRSDETQRRPQSASGYSGLRPIMSFDLWRSECGANDLLRI